MSVESARAFYDRLASDEEFAVRILTAPDAAERLAVVHEEGYDFQKEHFEHATHELLRDRRIDEASPASRKVGDVALSLLEVIAVRVASFYGPDVFFTEEGPMRLDPPVRSRAGK